MAAGDGADAGRDGVPDAAFDAHAGFDAHPVLPDVTRDESDEGWGESPEADDLERYLRERPPHHE
ncbi:MAG TPA: hypothetical protein VMI11_11305 [Actinomycetes bacterium]|nr:hypothetical protein [Actinomycetes bacterium]